METIDYNKQAIDFLSKTNTEVKAKLLENDFHFSGDKDKRDIYKITLKKGQREFSFKFGQSIMNSQYYQDRIKERTYTLNGNARTGNYKITDIDKYKNSGSVFDPAIKLVVGKFPNAYDVLSCLTKYDPGTFENFCGDFGYDTDSRKAKKTYKAVCKEYKNLCGLYNESELEELREIN